MIRKKIEFVSEKQDFGYTPVREGEKQFTVNKKRKEHFQKKYRKFPMNNRKTGKSV